MRFELQACAEMQAIPDSHSRHRCSQPKGHEPHWHQCPCGHVWRPGAPLPDVAEPREAVAP